LNKVAKPQKERIPAINTVGETTTQTMDESTKIKITGKESLSDTGSTQQLPFNAKIK